METTRKKALAVMQKGVVTYKLLSLAWDISDHFGDGYDLTGVKGREIIKIELKAIDLNAILPGKNATQHITANEIVNSTHLIITVFDDIVLQSSYIMNIRQFIENSGVKKYKKYRSYEEFLSDYIELARNQSERRKNDESKKVRLDFDFSFNPRTQEKWKFSVFKDQWANLDTPT